MMENKREIGHSINRLPGQSLRERCNEIWDGGACFPFMLWTMGVTLLWIELTHVYGGLKPSIWIGVVPFVVLSVFLVYRVFMVRRSMGRFRQGEKGELIVARDENGKKIYGSQFPSFEVHHKRAVSTSGDLTNTASINYRDNLCLVLSDIHTHVLHGFDFISDSKRDSYSRRTEFIFITKY